MESLLDHCGNIAGKPRSADAFSDFGPSIEEKVKAVLLDPEKGLPEDESMAWLGLAILDTKALLDFLGSWPQHADRRIAEFLHEWFADTDAEAWAGKNTEERIRQLLGIFCFTLEAFHDGLREEVGKQRAWDGEADDNTASNKSLITSNSRPMPEKRNGRCG
jgi:hypothetical protein